MDYEAPQYRIALSDFKNARRKAALQEIISRITGQPDALIPFEEARKRLQASGEKSRGLQEIPLKAIIGSVGRYADFNRNFLPRHNSQSRRWVDVKASLIHKMVPIQVYQIGEAYFVIDGNHRVSIARERGDTQIAAYVTKIHTKVPLTPETDLNDFILKAEYTEFLAHTNIDKSCPQAELSITSPGRYKTIEKHIALHREKLNAASDEEIGIEEAACDWYKNIYLPVVKIIRNRGILRGFPKRTVTDLYVWLSEHQERLREDLGWSVDLDLAADDLVDQKSEGLRPKAQRLVKKVRTALIPALLEAGPAPGTWREEYGSPPEEEALFAHILVPLRGTEDSWQALEQAILLAKRENAHLLGLHIEREEAEMKKPAAQKIARQFEERCKAEGLIGEFALDFGGISSVINKRARWSDLVILHLAYPPQPQIVSRLGSGLRQLLQRCPRPVLAVPSLAKKLDRILVAYDGSPKANEALYMAAYFAGRWRTSLFVLTVQEAGTMPKLGAIRAKRYLKKQKIAAEYIQKEGAVGQSILQAVDENEIDLIVMGGYSRKPVAEVILGSSLDEVLRSAKQPVLICR